MADVKWIKLIVNIFDDTKIKLIEKLPQGDTIIVIWFKLLCLAGKANENGAIMINSEIAFNEDMLIAYLDREPIICKLALKTFEQYRMIEIIDNIFLLANWEKHQNIDGLNTIREQNKLRQQKYRDNKKNLKIETKNKEEDLDIESERYVTLRTIKYLNSKLDTSYKHTTNKTKTLINARINEGFTYEDFVKAIDNAYNFWSKQGNDYSNMKPNTLFNGNFESRVNGDAYSWDDTQPIEKTNAQLYYEQVEREKENAGD